MILEQINRQNEEENEKWIQAEKIAKAQWEKLQEEKEKLKQKRLEQEAKIKLVRKNLLKMYPFIFKKSVCK